MSKDSWQSEREGWNAEGRCAREACGQSHDDCAHTGTKLLYCLSCARKINEANPEVPGLVAIPEISEIRALRLARRAERVSKSERVS